MCSSTINPSLDMAIGKCGLWIQLKQQVIHVDCKKTDLLRICVHRCSACDSYISAGCLRSKCQSVLLESELISSGGALTSRISPVITSWWVHHLKCCCLMPPGLNEEINEAVDRTGLFAVPPYSPESWPPCSLMKTNRYNTDTASRDRWRYRLSSDCLKAIEPLGESVCI